MSKSSLIAIVIVAAAAAAGGYWIGTRHAPAPASTVVAAPNAAPDAAKPGTDPGAKPARKLLYSRNPMGLPDTSPMPKKDSMGMDYLPVYEGEDEPASGVKISTEKLQKIGVRTAKVERRTLDAVVRATGRVEVDERRVMTVTAKYEGYIEKLMVNATGQSVTRGQPLFEAYSPDLLAAQREYAVAMQGVAKLKDADAQTQAGMKQLAESALARLRNWDVTADDVAQLQAVGATKRTPSFKAPATGIVMERKATQGMRFMPGEMLFQIADLSSVWVIADVFEQDIGRVRVGQTARVQLDAYPGQTLSGRVSYIYPTLKAETRAAQVRIELTNPAGRLKPAMYARVEIPTGGGAVLAVPASAVIDSGARRVVLIDLGGGRFEPRDVELGARGDDFVAILKGVKEGEIVVVSANFLIDSESNLKAALGGLTAAPASAPASAPSASGKVHTAVGSIDAVDAKDGTLLISHEPIASLKWPKMTMEFKPSNDAIVAAAKAAKAVNPGAKVSFEFVERKPGEWVVTKIEAGR